MDDARIGRALRVLRQRRGLRQAEVAVAAGVTQSTISDIECGRLSGLPVATIRRVFAAVDAGFEGMVHWRGAGLDRLLDARHASLVAASVHRLAGLEWDTRVETTYSIYGERGSIDVLGALARVRAVLVEEVKSELASLEETIRKLDEKVRLVRKEIAFDQFGWQPAVVGRLLVLPESATARRRVAALHPVLSVAFPDRGSDIRRWLSNPRKPCRGSFSNRISPRAMLDRTDAASNVFEAAEKVISAPDIAGGDIRRDLKGELGRRGARVRHRSAYDRRWRYPAIGEARRPPAGHPGH